MLSEQAYDPSPEFRERRRRRIETRPSAVISAAGFNSPAVLSRQNIKAILDLRVSPTSSEEVASELLPTAKNMTTAADAAPVFGVVSIAGRSGKMEDAISVRTDLCRPEINRREPVHFFGVFDGHGGPHVAELCRERMHVFMEEELMHVGVTKESEKGGGNGGGSGGDAEQRRWRAAMRRCFERLDEVALNMCACGSAIYTCRCSPTERAVVGSTAVVAVLTANHIIVANCGDSRAVLCRGGKAVPLSFDHKPDRADEQARIESSGGRVINAKGARVEGVLAVSRALGDKYLKPFVCSEPEVSLTSRQPEDEFLILASDGLWDVLSSKLACEVAGKCLREGNGEDERTATSSFYQSRSASAAALLARLALGRRSSDNISVIVVDLKRKSEYKIEINFILYAALSQAPPWT
ncbi:Phosphoprotein phosphatase [Bertholletia excelsa]